MNRKPILPPTYFWIAVLISLLFHFVYPVTVLFNSGWLPLGVFLILMGGVLNIWADQLFKKRSTTVKPFERPAVLVTQGPFAWLRHPMYFGMLAILLGLSMIWGSLTSLVGPIGFWLVIRLRFIPAEERSMAEVFGDQYSHYKKRVFSWM